MRRGQRVSLESSQRPLKMAGHETSFSNLAEANLDIRGDPGDGHRLALAGRIKLLELRIIVERGQIGILACPDGIAKAGVPRFT